MIQSNIFYTHAHCACDANNLFVYHHGMLASYKMVAMETAIHVQITLVLSLILQTSIKTERNTGP